MNKIWKNAIGCSFLHFMQHAQEPWGLKDTESRFVFANKAYYELLNLPNTFDLTGRTDSEMPAPTSEFADTFFKHDRQTEQHRKKITSLEVHPFGQSQKMQAYGFDKTPCIDVSDRVIGTIFHGFSLSHEYITLSKQLNHLIFMNKKTPASWITQHPTHHETLSEREHTVLFLLVLNFKAKDIALRLCKSVRTIENSIAKIMSKTGIHNTKQLREWALEKGHIKYLPKILLHSNSIIIG